MTTLTDTCMIDWEGKEPDRPIELEQAMNELREAANRINAEMDAKNGDPTGPEDGLFLMIHTFARDMLEGGAAPETYTKIVLSSWNLSNDVRNARKERLKN